MGASDKIKNSAEDLQCKADQAKASLKKAGENVKDAVKD
jgi:uncharacterized protein YjbJ (UPF0337 family)